MLIRLTPGTVAYVAEEARHVCTDARRRGQRDRFAQPGSAYANTVLGFSGEAAVAEALELEWTPGHLPQGNGPDVGPYEVKTRRDPAGPMYVKTNRVVAHRAYIAVTARAVDLYELVGWTYGYVVETYPVIGYNGYAPAHAVPYDALAAIEQLPRGEQ